MGDVRDHPGGPGVQQCLGPSLRRCRGGRAAGHRHLPIGLAPDDRPGPVPRLPAALAIRAEIPALAKTTYLNAAGIGPSPRAVTDTIVGLYRQIELESPDLMAFGKEEFTQAEATRARVAAHWRVEPDEVALLRSTAEGFNLIGHGLSWRAGDER